MPDSHVDQIARVRPAGDGDREFILALAPRLVEFGPPPWRDPARMIETDRQVLGDALSDRSPDAAIFIAEDQAGRPLGFIHVITDEDYYTRQPHAHVADVVVAPPGEGRGVAAALMSAAEAWGRDRGYGLITLNVFVENRRARGAYDKFGYREETVKYIKQLD